MSSLNTNDKVPSITYAKVDVRALLQSERQEDLCHVNLHAMKQLHIKTFVFIFTKLISKEIFEGFIWGDGGYELSYK
ncbi:hypothetical protein BBEV_0313 [Salisediminibacterium beveridgei]|uniref:Uncharacterized protein n=1 Tax=Salisediminibacterium beveridgei TaxID=632773 RepID=A0A1D7QRR9_9BACI|nr:hypothetical protein BBEV_0313 [Salisediminibacterium beveridgei]